MSYVEFERRGKTAVITLNRPERLNAFGYEVLCELADAFTMFRDDRDLVVGVLRATGRAFSVGMDIKEHAERGGGPLRNPDIRPRTNPFWPDNTLLKPTISAVQGYAYGGGFYLAMCADLCVAAESARFEISEVHRAGLSGWEVGHLWSLPPAMRMELSLGGSITATRAHQIGLINDVVPDDEVLDRALATAEDLHRVAPAVLRHNLAMTRALAPTVPDNLYTLRSVHSREVAESADGHEAIASFTERRPPVWTNY